MRDLARAVRVACQNPALAQQSLEPVGPETMSLRDMLGRYRAWLGFGRARFLPLPLALMRVLGRIGDLAGDGPISTTSLTQTIAGNAGDSAAFARAIGFTPRGMAEALRNHPAEVQDRWHARLFFLAPALQAVLVVMWLASAWAGWAHGAAQSDALVRSLGLPAGLAEPLRLGSCAVDMVIAGLLLSGRQLARITQVQLLVVAAYTVVIGYALPQLWLDPLGPLLKNLPVMLAIAVYGMIGEKR